MENTQENPTSQNPTPVDETGRAAADATASAVQPEGVAPAESADTALAEAQAKIVELQESFLLRDSSPGQPRRYTAAAPLDAI